MTAKPRCPRCAAYFTPGDLREATTFVRCGYCEIELLLELPRTPPPARPRMPQGLVVLEAAATPAPASHVDPYRASVAPPPGPSLTVERYGESVTVDPQCIVWSRKPRRRIDLIDVAQVFAFRYRTRDVHGLKITKYQVVVKLRSEEEETVAVLDTVEQARWLEWAVHRHLKISDRPVEGALR